eukprot:jgi/Botrbrau1/23103/Bobra.0243s0039.1
MSWQLLLKEVLRVGMAGICIEWQSPVLEGIAMVCVAYICWHMRKDLSLIPEQCERAYIGGGGKSDNAFTSTPCRCWLEAPLAAIVVVLFSCGQTL